jgi:hypothetical protein
LFTVSTRVFWTWVAVDCRAAWFWLVVAWRWA